MPVVDAQEKLPQRVPIIMFHGDPGSCKSSLIHTCENPILIDFDRGVNRSYGRKTTLVPDSWQEVLDEDKKGLFKKYNTIGIDTTKSALDDFIMPHIIKQDARMGTMKFKLQAFGAIGDIFKQFVNTRRVETASIVLIAHTKRDEDTKKMMPDITGQSYQLLMRIADQVGYIYIKNGERWVTFDPSESVVGKNTAQLPDMKIPHHTSEEFKTFGAQIIEKVKEALNTMSSEQQQALEESEKYQELISEAEAITDLEFLCNNVNELPQYLRTPLLVLIGNRYCEYINECKTPEELDYMLTVANTSGDYLMAGLRKKVSGHAKLKGWKPNILTKKFEPITDAAAEVAETIPDQTKENK